MKTTSFAAAAAAIRKHHRAGMSADQLAMMYNASEHIIQKILRTRTIEAAAAVLDELENTSRLVRRFLHVDGQLVDCTNLLQRRRE